MSVNINFRPTSNTTRWSSIKDGDFAILEGTPEHPIPSGLYRVFVISSDQHAEIAPTPQFILLPIFDGPFNPGTFPYIVSSAPMPEIKHLIHKVHVDVEIS